MKATDRTPSPALAEPLYCVVGDTLCRVRVYTEAEWERLGPSTRPAPAEHVAGLGWVAAVRGRGAGPGW